MADVIVLLTDFGHGDHYVGVLHAVLARLAPGTDRIDLAHEVAPGDVWEASHLLRCAWPHLPVDAVVVAVVDPGVGSDRRAVAARIGKRWLVAPDNGLAAAVGPASEVIRLSADVMHLGELSATFHGRDLFAPAAARLACGQAPSSLGAPMPRRDLVTCPIPEPVAADEGVCGVIVHVDRFGNLVTNVPADLATSPSAMRWGGRGPSARRVACYAEGHDAEVVFLEGSSGVFELTVNRGSAAESTGLLRGDAVFAG